MLGYPGYILLFDMLGIPVAYVMDFVFNLGVGGVWTSLALGLTASAQFMHWRYQP